MTYRIDPNRPLGGPLHRPVDHERSTKMVWGTLAALAVLLVAGFMFYSSGEHGPQTVSSTPAATQMTSAPAPAPKQ